MRLRVIPVFAEHLARHHVYLRLKSHPLCRHYSQAPEAAFAAVSFQHQTGDPYLGDININANYDIPGGANPAILIQNTSFNRKRSFY